MVVVYISLQTPSPHRFLVKQKKSQQEPQKTQTPDPSAKRRPIPPITPSSAAPSRAAGHFSHEPPKPSTAGRTQFAPTPRFGFARPPSPKRPRLTQEKHELHFQTPLRFRDDHEENLIEEDDDFNEIDQEHEGHEVRVAWPQFLPALAPVTANEEVHDDSDVIMSDTQLPSHHRPAFLPTAIAPTQQAEPLPEVFSPHRRGQKFVPGGMAEMVRGWVLDAGASTSNGSVRGRGDEGWRVRVYEVSEVGSGGMTLMRGLFEDGSGEGWIEIKGSPIRPPGASC